MAAFTESPCEDCVMRQIPMGEAVLEYVRVRPSDAEDRADLAPLPDAERLLAALALNRPERCAALGKLLPRRRHSTVHSRPLEACPEIALKVAIEPRLPQVS